MGRRVGEWQRPEAQPKVAVLMAVSRITLSAGTRTDDTAGPMTGEILNLRT